MGQLLVVARHTDTSPSSCYELGLIPDPTTLDISGTMHPSGITQSSWIWDQLIPDLFALQYRDIVQNLLKDLIWQKEIWDQMLGL